MNLNNSTQLKSIKLNSIVLKFILLCFLIAIFCQQVKSDDSQLDENDNDNLKLTAKSISHKNADQDDNDSKEHKDKHLTASFSFIHALFASFSVILVSEIGDKTFFIAAIMAMKHSRLTVYSGAMFALGLMTLLSALLGNILTKLIPKVYTYYASSILFGIFGLKMLREGWHMDPNEDNEEYEEANSTLRENEEKLPEKTWKQEAQVLMIRKLPSLFYFLQGDLLFCSENTFPLYFYKRLC